MNKELNCQECQKPMVAGAYPNWVCLHRNCKNYLKAVSVKKSLNKAKIIADQPPVSGNEVAVCEHQWNLMADEGGIEYNKCSICGKEE